MEKDIGKIKKNDNTDIVVRIDDFGGRIGLTIREFVTGDRYTGFTKAGTRIPADSFKNFKEMINSIDESELGEGVSGESGQEQLPEDSSSEEKSEEENSESENKKDVEESYL